MRKQCYECGTWLELDDDNNPFIPDHAAGNKDHSCNVSGLHVQDFLLRYVATAIEKLLNPK